MAAQTPNLENGFKAPSFELPATDGRVVKLSDVAGPKGTLVAFICNHCPYVHAIIDRLVRDANDLAPLGVASVAICSNDSSAYPEDSFENMKLFARDNAFPFPYLHDASQDVARAYGAVCTPDFFGFDGELMLQYRGRLDASRNVAGPTDLKRDLFDAMKSIADTGSCPEEQQPSLGCSIKWR